MSRVENKDAQRAKETQRVEKKNADQTRSEGQKFAQMVNSKQSNVKKGTKSAVLQKMAQKSAGSQALLARQGIMAGKFQSVMQHQGKASLDGKALTTKSRSEDGETKKAGGEKETKADNKAIDKQGDKLAAISRDDRQSGGGGGGGGAMGGGNSGDNKEALATGGAAALGESSGMKEAEAVTGANAPKLPQAVVDELVKRVMVGVDKEGLSQFHIEFKEDVLAGSRMQISVKDGKISVKFETEDVNVGRLLKASEGQLHRAFAHKGLSLERLDVTGG
ncbi:hypothetical protein KAI87_00320 [Myxococcota bacterium]|nr:hypothetical protein [Myxococcota bacterium]